MRYFDSAAVGNMYAKGDGGGLGDGGGDGDRGLLQQSNCGLLVVRTDGVPGGVYGGQKKTVG